MIIINGTIDLHKSVNLVLVIPEAMNRLQPTGGVMNPIAILTTMIRLGQSEHPRRHRRERLDRGLEKESE